MIINNLTFRQKLTWLAHAWKAIAFQHHKELAAPFSRYINKDSTVLDIGAHAGQFAKLFAGLAPNGRVISFEPGSYARAILSRVVSLRNLKNVEIKPLAVGSQKSSFILNVPVKKSGSLGFGLSFVGDPSTVDRQVLSEEINIVTLDEELAGQDGTLPKINFIKADIEGFELEMLRGARKIISQSHPALFIEVGTDTLNRAGGSRKELFDLLKGEGYFPTDVKTGIKQSWEELENVSEDLDILFICH
ncbi:FkbM family methyltransferase [Kiloniella majae]|uniref:FkbM family methyltransferase n=1 Tax=Kiloniella majae TaxID=1938558 RepID=UPI000A278C93|nr:FkbM family methyltransferase [Kiloniella majae]